jgi:hypothetical protein
MGSTTRCSGGYSLCSRRVSALSHSSGAASDLPVLSLTDTSGPSSQYSSFLQGDTSVGLTWPSIGPEGSFDTDEASSDRLRSDMLSEMQDKLEVSYQWAHDLESDLEDAHARARRTEGRCQVLQDMVSKREKQLRGAIPR